MIIEPRKTAEEIDRRLSAFTDPALADLLEDLKRGFAGDDSESYTSASAPYWRRRIGFVALAGLFALSAGYASIATASHTALRAKPRAAAAIPAPRHRKAAIRRLVVKRKTALAKAIVTPAIHAAPAAAQNEALVRHLRAQLLQERTPAAREKARAIDTHHQTAAAMQAAMAREWARDEALAQARAEARAEAVASAQADDAAAQERAHDRAVDDAAQTAGTPPSNPGRVTSYPGGAPLPIPGPIDTNCTPHRGSLFGTMLQHVRIGGTSVGGLLQLVGQ